MFLAFILLLLIACLSFCKLMKCQKRVTKSIHSMYEGGQINWAVMDTLQSSIDNVQEMPF
ncbi:hypothetical protein [Acinetobacter phage Ab69]|nr:hypothetical protein [Acinetobacter phage Ab69]